MRELETPPTEAEVAELCSVAGPIARRLVFQRDSLRLERNVLALNRMRKDNPVITVVDSAGEVVAVTWPDAETTTAADDPIRLPAYVKQEATA